MICKPVSDIACFVNAKLLSFVHVHETEKGEALAGAASTLSTLYGIAVGYVLYPLGPLVVHILQGGPKK